MRRQKKRKSHHFEENFMGSTDVRLVKDILMEKVILGTECFVEKGARKPTRFMVNKHEKCGFSQSTMAEFH